MPQRDPQAVIDREFAGRIDRATVNAPAGTRAETFTVGGGLRLGRRTPAACVSFVFDDGYAEDVSVVLPIFQAKGKVATAAIVSDWVGTAGKMTADQIRTLQAAGWEIASHSKSHLGLAAETDEAVIYAETGGAAATLRAMGLDVRSHVWPSGQHTALSRTIARDHFRCAISVGAAGQVNAAPLETPFWLPRQDIDAPTTLVQAKAMVDQAVADGAWLITMGHSGLSNFAGTSALWLGDLLDYCDTAGCDVLTVDGALDRFGSLLDTSEDERSLVVGPDGRYVLGGIDDYAMVGKTEFASVAAVTGETPPDDPAFLGERTHVRFVGLAGAAGLPTSGAGSLVTVNDSIPGDAFYSLRQYWYEARTGRAWVRTAGASASVWAAWKYLPPYSFAGVTSSIDPGAMAAHSTSNINITSANCPGLACAATDNVVVSPTNTPESGLVWSAVAGSNLVVLRLANVTAGIIDPGARTWKVATFSP